MKHAVISMIMNLGRPSDGAATQNYSWGCASTGGGGQLSPVGLQMEMTSPGSMVSPGSLSHLPCRYTWQTPLAQKASGYQQTAAMLFTDQTSLPGSVLATSLHLTSSGAWHRVQNCSTVQKLQPKARMRAIEDRAGAAWFRGCRV